MPNSTLQRKQGSSLAPCKEGFPTSLPLSGEQEQYVRSSIGSAGSGLAISHPA